MASTLKEIKMWYESGQIAKAEKAYLIYLNKHPLEKEAYDQLSQLYLKEHQPEKAAFLYNYLGNLLFREKLWIKAAAAYQQGIEYHEHYADAYYNLGLCYQKMEKNQLAITAYQTLLKYSPLHPGALFQLASLAMQNGFYQKALAYLIPLTNKYPFHFESQFNIAVCYIKLGQIKLAKQHLEKAYEINANDAEVLFNLGHIAEQLGDFIAADKYYSLIIKLNPNYFPAYFNLGVIHLNLKDKKKSLGYFQQALHLRPDDASSQYMIAALSAASLPLFAPETYVRNLFDAYSESYEAHLTDTLHYKVPFHFKNIIEQLTFSINSLNVLDLGCGTGLCGAMIAPYAKRLIGIDLSPAMLKKAREKNLYDELIEMSVGEYLNHTQECYDLILAGDLIEYVGELETLFKQINSVLQPSGYFIFNTEILEKGNYQLQSSGRFMHSKYYIDQIIAGLGWVIKNYQTLPLRTQESETVSGHYYLIQKSV